MNKLYALLLPALLTSLLGCTQENDQLATAMVANAGSYKFTGKLVKCQASATSGEIISQQEHLESIAVDLHAISSNPDSTSSLFLSFQRPIGQPSSAYQLAQGVIYFANSKQPPAFYDDVVATLHETNDGLVSGTFSCAGPTKCPISAGTFTRVLVKPPGNE